MTVLITTIVNMALAGVLAVMWNVPVLTVEYYQGWLINDFS